MILGMKMVMSLIFSKFADNNIQKKMLYGQVSIDPEVMSGTPVFAGTRVPVQNLFDYIEGGDDLEEFLDDFPSVSKEAALAVLEMAKKSLTTEKVLHENFA
jgi:uncharacterized protein (DUF433 family)